MPRDGRRNRERILDAAESLIIDGGYSATSLDAIIAAAGTSKGAFFHHFGSKAELADALVERYADADVGQLRAALASVGEQADAGARLLAFLDWFIAGADELMGEQSSCLYIAVLVERELVGAGTAQPVRRAVMEWRGAVADLVRRADAERGERGAVALSADDLADHLFVTFEGAFLLARATGDASHMRRQLATLRALVAAWLA
ncbi:TetR/AcrR family transcriptional regulator [Propioniciclava coleopterorum]|uniref:TetR/AcrR family transcriptional regulator n=1 Tax=Propioniciclava coleopterorum TaxID=2714937 RepID=A0A6G7Y3X0_9ACTN|nr:TetR/AcrR family transcriptional regulator [Propioniciclava coleopterorum]QIK71584.1 TetR/AcrR family transcriptional regulator [Propioniciclava coleopterorum]